MLQQQFFDLLENTKLFTLSPAIAVAVSGGPDSMALVCLLNVFCKINRKKLVALTVDHRLRPESEMEAKQVSITLQNYKIQHEILVWEHEEIRGNIMAAAREARYQLLTNYCQQNGINQLYVAHQLDDVAENFLQRLERGSGLEGLAAMETITYKNDIAIIRPLLQFTKDQLLSYLHTNKIAYVTDPTNNNLKYKKTQIRAILASGFFDKERIYETAIHLQKAKKALDKYLSIFIKDHVTIRDNGAAELPIEAFRGFDEYEAYTILARLLCQVGGKEIKPRFESTNGLYLALMKEEKLTRTLHDCIIKLSKGKITISKEYFNESNII